MKAFTKIFRSRSSQSPNSPSPPLNSSCDVSDVDSAGHVILLSKPQNENDHYQVLGDQPKVLVNVEEISLSPPLPKSSQPSHNVKSDFSRKRHRTSSSSEDTNLLRHKSVFYRLFSRKRSKNESDFPDLLIPVPPVQLETENIVAYVDSALVESTRHSKRNLSLRRVFSFSSKGNSKRNSFININNNSRKRASILSFSSDVNSVVALQSSQDSVNVINSQITETFFLPPERPAPILEYQHREISMPSAEEQRKYMDRLREITQVPQNNSDGKKSPVLTESSSLIPLKPNSNQNISSSKYKADSLILEPCTEEDILRSIEYVVKVQKNNDKNSDSSEQNSDKGESFNLIPSPIRHPPDQSEDLQSYRKSPRVARQQYQPCDDMWEVSGVSDMGDTEDNCEFVDYEQIKRPKVSDGFSDKIFLRDGASSILDVEKGEANRTRPVAKKIPKSKLSRVVSLASGFTDDSKVYDGDVEDVVDYESENGDDEEESFMAASNLAVCNPDDDGYDSDSDSGTSSGLENDGSSFDEDVTPHIKFLGKFLKNNLFDDSYNKNRLTSKACNDFSDDDYYSAKSTSSLVMCADAPFEKKPKLADFAEIWDLPADIHFQISRYLMGHDLKNMAQTCRTLRPIYASFSWANCVVISGVMDKKFYGPKRTFQSQMEMSNFCGRYYYFKRQGDMLAVRFVIPEIVATKNTRCIPFRVFLNPGKYSWFFSQFVVTITFKCMFSSVHEGKEWDKFVHFSDLYTFYPKLLYVKVGYNAFSSPSQPNNPQTLQEVDDHGNQALGYAESVFSVSSELSEFASGKSGAALVYSLLDGAELQGFTTSIPNFEVQLILESPYYLLNLPGKLVLRSLDVGFFFDIDSNSMSAGYDISEFENLENLRLIFKSITYRAHWTFMSQILELPRLRRFVTSINPLSNVSNTDRLYSINNWVNLLRNLSLICPETNDRRFFRKQSVLDDISISGSFPPIQEREIATVPGKLFFPRVTEVITDSIDIFNYAKFGPKLKSLKILDNVGLPEGQSPIIFFSKLASNISGNLTSLCLHCLEGTRSITGLIPLLCSPLVQNIKKLTLNIEYQYNVFNPFSPAFSFDGTDEGNELQPSDSFHKEGCHLRGSNLNKIPKNPEALSTLKRICDFLEFLSTENLIPVIESCYEDGQGIDGVREEFYSIYGPMMIDNKIENYHQMISSFCINPMINLFLWDDDSLFPIDPCEYHLYMASFFECLFDAVVHTMFSLEYLRVNAISRYMERPIWKYVTNSLRFQEHVGAYLKAPYVSELERDNIKLDYHSLKQVFINDMVPLDPQNYCTCVLDRNYEFACEIAQDLPSEYTTVTRTSPPVDISIVLDIEARRRDFAIDYSSFLDESDSLVCLSRINY